jgi:hypothetical protein
MRSGRRSEQQVPVTTDSHDSSGSVCRSGICRATRTGTGRGGHVDRRSVCSDDLSDCAVLPTVIVVTTVPFSVDQTLPLGKLTDTHSASEDTYRHLQNLKVY